AATGVAWASNPFRPGFATLYLRGPNDAAHVVVDAFDRVDRVGDEIQMTATATSPDGGHVVVRFNVTAVSPRSLRFSYETLQEGEWKVHGVRLLDHGFSAASSLEGTAVVPHRLGILIPAHGDLPEVRQFAN